MMFAFGYNGRSITYGLGCTHHLLRFHSGKKRHWLSSHNPPLKVLMLVRPTPSPQFKTLHHLDLSGLEPLHQRI